MKRFTRKHIANFILKQRGTDWSKVSEDYFIGVFRKVQAMKKSLDKDAADVKATFKVVNGDK